MRCKYYNQCKYPISRSCMSNPQSCPYFELFVIKSRPSAFDSIERDNRKGLDSYADVEFWREGEEL